MMVGTPAYVAPERLTGAGATPASDLYSLGIVAYECLAGALPFTGTAMEVVLSHQMRPLPPLPAAVPAEAAALVAELTAKDPAARPASAGEVVTRAVRVRDALTGVPSAAGATSPSDGATSPSAGAISPSAGATLAGSAFLAAPPSVGADAHPGEPSASAGERPASPGAEADRWAAAPSAWSAPPAAEADAWPAAPFADAGAWLASQPAAAIDAQADTLVGPQATLREIGTPGPARPAQHRLVARDRARRRRVIVLAVAAGAVVALAGWMLAGLSGGTSAHGRPPGPSSASSTPHTKPPASPATRTVQVDAGALIGQPVGVVTQRLRQLGLRVRVEAMRTNGRRLARCCPCGRAVRWPREAA